MSQTTVEPEPPSLTDLLAGYPRGDDLFDEAFSIDGELLPHYAPFVESIQKLGAPELKRRRDSCRHNALRPIPRSSSVVVPSQPSRELTQQLRELLS